MSARIVYMLIAVLSMCIAVGCAPSTPSPDSPPAEPPVTTSSTPSVAEAQQVRNAEIVDGYDVSIPKIGLVRSDLVALGLNPDRSIQVPPLSDVGQLGLYRFGPRPGARGPAVILGHVNGHGVPGAFARLDELVGGDHINVNTPQGPRRFVVDSVFSKVKTAFPTSVVYSDTPDAELRLITCGGEYDPKHRNYLSNIIVIAKLEQR